ncbi:hypothetical protein ACFOLJ_28275 [Rugamonas sp. CCM 8940]|uniref:hypothetical protein n=1 Tax=Rugamonas sp. CCM 8940 TaxID=2765359 RepID=UPI0018F56889|nr:hypothetical protein [Rugamonas sp. CCM 8940]MBJ7312830.1 hypothetical protein [Rugamonas sp. CCM 8940]
MRLPGTRYQEHGWEQVRKLLGRCSVQAFRQFSAEQVLCPPGRQDALLEHYTEAVAAALRAADKTARAEAHGNSYGDSVSELALSLLFELQAQAGFWAALLAAIAAEHGRGGAFWHDVAADGVLRKKFNDMYAGLRDKVDADNYSVSTGRPCSPNKIYTYRMLDTAYREVERLFAGWQQHQGQVGEILGRELAGSPIEARQMKSIAGCKAEWIIRWSASLERYDGAPGPLHTRSKRFASLKNSPEKIAAMLAEIGDYEELSSNMDSADAWQGNGDSGAAVQWLEDYWRVVGESEAAESGGAFVDAQDRILPAPTDDELAADADAAADDEAADEPLAEVTARRLREQELDEAPAGVDDAALLAREQRVADALSLPPRYLELARLAQDGGSWTLRILSQDSLPIRLAVYHKLLGPDDSTYPDEWLDPATGALPTLQQLATLDQISMPTLRKRRNEAIDRLHAAHDVSHEAAPRAEAP